MTPWQVSLDKPGQYRAGLRTIRAQLVPELLRLPARVIADPRRELRIAAPQDGVIEAEGGELPLPGSRVGAGQALAWLRPVLPQPQRRELDVDLNTAERDLKLGRLQIDRYGIDEKQKLEVKLPTPSIEILTGYRSAQARSGELRTALQRPLPLLAPRDGAVLRSPAVVGAVAAAGQTLFELVADAHSPGVVVEAEYSDDSVAAAAARQALDRDGRAISLQFLGTSYDASLRSHRTLYAVTDAGVALSVNQPLLLLAPGAEARVRLPSTAVFHHAGQDWVWLHTQAQSFAAQPVELVSNDGQVAEIAGGLRDGARVVTEGVAALDATARGERP